jgi:hypothetical protein
LWEEPTRSVFIWKAPGITAAGGVCNRTVDSTCMFPTLCSLAGLPTPAHLEGREITPLLKIPNSAWDYPAITTHGYRNHAVRSENWRYIRYANGEEELYDVAADPLEYTNLAGRAEHATGKGELAKWLPSKDAPNLPTSAAKAGRGKKAKKGAANAKSATSALSDLDFGVDRFEFAAGVVNFHLPIDTALHRIDVAGPRGGLGT